MRYIVNNDCIGCGLCVGTCPEVFYIKNNETAAVKEEDIPTEHFEIAALVKRECPVEAIKEA